MGKLNPKDWAATMPQVRQLASKGLTALESCNVEQARGYASAARRLYARAHPAFREDFPPYPRDRDDKAAMAKHQRPYALPGAHERADIEANAAMALMRLEHELPLALQACARSLPSTKGGKARKPTKARTNPRLEPVNAPAVLRTAAVTDAQRGYAHSRAALVKMGVDAAVDIPDEILALKLDESPAIGVMAHYGHEDPIVVELISRDPQMQQAYDQIFAQTLRQLAERDKRHPERIAAMVAAREPWKRPRTR